MQLEPAHQPQRSINLATPDFLVMNGTARGGRSGLLKEAEILLSKAEKAGSADDYYYFKNLEDIRRYLPLVARLRSGINQRVVSSKEAPGGVQT